MAARVPRWLRILLPAVLVLVWLAAASVGGPYFGRVDEVSSNDRTLYLPESAESTRTQERLSDFLDADAIPAVVVFTGQEPLDDTTLRTISDRMSAAADLPGIHDGASPAIPSEDGLAAQAFVPIDSNAEVGEVVEELSTTLRDGLPDDVEVFVTGPAGFSADLAAGFAGIDGLLLLVALGAVLVILVLVYRSFLLPIAVLATSMCALCVALLSVWWLAKSGTLLLSGQTQGILFILVIGAATDYALLYVARFREELRRTRSTWEATGRAWRASLEPILASGGTVIAGLLCLLFSDLRSNSTLGPVAAIGIAFAVLSALTLLPAILLGFGRAAFWPRRPRFEPEAVAAENGRPAGGLWTKVAGGVRRSPRALWMGATLLLIAGTLGVTQLQASGVPQSELVLGASEAREGQEALGAHFPGGSGSPTYLVVPEADLADVGETLTGIAGIDSVAVTAADSPAGTVPLESVLAAEDPGRSTAEAPADSAGAAPGAGPGAFPAEPTVAGGDVLLQATLASAADSADAERTVRAIRTQVHAVSPDVLVGGVTATTIDTNDAAIHDRNLIIPIVLAVILVILVLLLRSVLAPVLLVATTVLSFGTALGVSALVFNDVLRFPGADPAVPLYGFVFLVALGIDYNIFLMTRVREESLVHGTQEGISRGLAITGGVITSAGVVLAATFAALAVIPILFLAQLAFIVAFGVLLDTFLVRSVLVPALAHDLGARIWWPNRRIRG
ncbi:MMPL family transporter [Brevibacterium samyangense]|uniref:Efflux RND transporter permease subunit n=1 Tax=Brevibacterium samyangense TaxID=366888 RepID=A0ABN2TG99_9MICO